MEEEENIENNRPIDEGIVAPGKSDEEEPLKEVEMKNEVERKADDKLANSAEENVTKNEKDEPAGASSSQAIVAAWALDLGSQGYPQDKIQIRRNTWPVVMGTNDMTPQGTSTTLIPGPLTADEKIQKKNDVKAGSNDAIKKTQKTPLKQMYDNFSAPSTESIDSIFNRLQKIVSQLAILGENISQEDLNLKFLKSLPSEWNTHIVVWRNKPDLDTMSFDDLYNIFKIVEQEVKRTANSSSSSQNMAFVSSSSSTNEVNTAYGVSTDNIQVSTTSTQVSTTIGINKDPTAGSNQGKEKKRPRNDTQPSKKSSESKESSNGNTPPKSSKSGKCVTIEELNEEHVHDMSMNAEENIVDEMGNVDEHPDGEGAPKNDWFKQPPRHPTPNPEWNKYQVVDDKPEQTCYNDLVFAQKDPLTFDELTTTLIDFSKFAKNRLKLDKITKVYLVGPVYNLLKGTCQSNIDLEYNMEVCYKALTDRLDWENLEGDQCPSNLSKPLPLKVRLGHLTIASEYFFNNDLEYLKSTDLERKYTTSFTKMKTSRYELVGIDDMIPKQWSVTKVVYDKDVERGIKHW
ncbi:hypothetical protein Tco_1490695 [Tanacetum coccineum]